VKRSCLAFVIVLLCGGTGYALDADQRHAKALLVELCARCHAVGRSGRSPQPDAPPFRTFSDVKLYDEDFGKRLRDGLSTMHPDMPTFHFSQRDSEAVVSYLRAIQVSRKP
jgi:mono/diheme cytochrome c family protein